MLPQWEGDPVIKITAITASLAKAAVHRDPSLGIHSISIGRGNGVLLFCGSTFWSAATVSCSKQRRLHLAIRYGFRLRSLHQNENSLHGAAQQKDRPKAALLHYPNRGLGAADQVARKHRIVVAAAIGDATCGSPKYRSGNGRRSSKDECALMTATPRRRSR